MNYEEILKTIAKNNNTTSETVENEIKDAIKNAGYDISPKLFISICAFKAKKTINSK